MTPAPVHLFWAQGLDDDAPPVVRAAVRAWRRLNPDREVRLLTAAEAAPVLRRGGFDLDGATIQVRADALRLCLLEQHGGIWADASVLPRRPLARWFDGQLDTGDLCAPRRGDPGRALSNWFLYAAPGDPLLAAWAEEARRYWHRPRALVRAMPVWRRRLHQRGPKTRPPAWYVTPGQGWSRPLHPYFWPHYLFTFRVLADPALAARWQAAPRLPGGPLHALLELRKAVADDAAFLARAPEAWRGAPIHKLNWRLDWPEPVLRRALGRAPRQDAPAPALR
ncbi:glycosyltransferase family 32 protein [Halovulum marinum]|uniref:glycosyltransferase family 32 protein n=1 Tax=Halovulum marinum TaxID=2662447 RepID=UPI0012B373D4|nr:capsular polysaccharide synthesis protein [Halovulum marinum]